MSERTFTERMFGKKLSTIPCFRTSFMSGISGGVFIYIARFLYTSDLGKSSRIGFLSYIGITAGTWIICRYRWAAMQVDEKAYKKAIQAKIMMEGTDLETEIEQNSKDV